MYAKEYINHYKKLGYDHIFIYDNNDYNGERFSDILSEEVKIGFVSIIDYIGYRGSNNNSQQEAYYDCYKHNRKKYDWLSFFDFDEYLVIKQKNKTIQEFLNNKIYKKCYNIKINWLNTDSYSYNETLYYQNKSLEKRFSKLIFNNTGNKNIKSTVRGNLNKNYWSKWLNPHSSSNNFKACSSSGKNVDIATPFIDPPDYKYAFLKHFGIKSFEEFCIKLKKGWPDSTNNMQFISGLIKANINNPEKIKIINKIFNLDIFKK